MKETEKNLNKIKTTLKGCGFKSDHTLEQWVMSGSLKNKEQYTFQSSCPDNTSVPEN